MVIRIREQVQPIQQADNLCTASPTLIHHLGIDVAGAPPTELDAFMRKEITRWAKVVKDNNIKNGD